MGYDFIVKTWVLTDNGNAGDILDYEWVTKYAGDNKVAAFHTLEELKRKGDKCVKLTWR